MVDGIHCFLLNLLFKLLLGLFFLFTFIFHFNFKPAVVVSVAPFVGTVDDIVASLHLAVDTAVSHFVFVVILCFALFSTSPIISSFRSFGLLSLSFIPTS